MCNNNKKICNKIIIKINIVLNNNSIIDSIDIIDIGG